MPVPKASNYIIQTLCQAYIQQLQTLHSQLKQQRSALSSMVHTAELPYIQQQYQSILNNLQEQQQICERLKAAL